MTTSDLTENDPQHADSPPADTQSTAGPQDSVAVEPNELLTAELSALREELQEAQSRALRAQAELENFRKRARRELDDERRYANIPLIRDVLNVRDDLHRALDAAEQHEAAASLREGVKIVAEHLAQVLEKFHCQQIDDLGTPFDPNLHEAIGQEPSNQYDAGVITRVVRPGYRIHERVVRPAQVMVSRGPQ